MSDSTGIKRQAPDCPVIKTDNAAPPVGPYSQAIKANGFVFVAGEKGMDPRIGKIEGFPLGCTAPAPL